MSSEEQSSSDDHEYEFKSLERRGTSILSMLSLNLLPFHRNSSKFIGGGFEAGSVRGATVTLIVSIVGAGTLSVPFAIQQSGLLFGIFLFSYGALMAAFTLNLIAISSQLTGIKSYEKIARRLYGKTAGNIAIIALALNLYGTTVSYVVASGHTLTYVINSFVSTPVDTGVVTVILLVVVIFPLSLLKTMSALRYSSLVAVCCAMYLSITVLLKYFQFCLDHTVVTIPNGKGKNLTETVTCLWEEQDHDIVLFNYNNPVQVMGALPIVVYAYTCHPSLLPILNELNKPTLSRMRQVANYSNLVSLLVYLLIGCFVYLTFKDENAYSHGNFLFNDFKKDGAVLLGAFAMAISLTFGVPLFVSSFRNIMIPILTYYFDHKTYIRISNYAKAQKRVPSLTERLLEDTEDTEDFLEKAQDDGPYVNMFWHTIVSLFLLIFAGMPSILVKDISYVFTILGGTTNPLLCFIFPTMFILKVGGPEYYWTKAFAVFSTLTLPLLCLVSLYLQVRNW